MSSLSPYFKGGQEIHHLTKQQIKIIAFIPSIPLKVPGDPPPFQSDDLLIFQCPLFFFNHAFNPPQSVFPLVQ